MITAISIFDNKTENTLNLYRDPMTRVISMDVNGGDNVALSGVDIGTLIEFLTDTASDGSSA